MSYANTNAESNTTGKCGINDFVYDESFSPNSDFFNYINNSWIKENAIPDDYTRWGGFEILHEQNLKRLHGLITNFDENNTDDKFANIVRLYNKGMNEEALQSEGISSINKYFKQIFSVNNKKDLFPLLGRFSMKGVASFFGVDVDADAKDSNNNVIYVSQSGLGLPDRDYYFVESKSEERVKYHEYLNKIFNNFNLSDVDEIRNKVYEMEEKLAKASQTKTERRDPHLTYNEFTFQKLCEDYPSIDWVSYINNTALFNYCEWTPLKQIKFVVDNPKFLEEVNMMFETYSLVELQWFIMNRMINSFATCLDDKTYEIVFDFFGRTLSGQKEPKPRWKRIMTTVQSLLGELLGKRYVESYFPEESKEKALEMVDDLKNSLEEKIKGLEWMTSETKEKALLKLNSFGVKIGYPDKWRDYSSLDCKSEYTYIDCVLHCREFQLTWEYSQLDLPVDRKKWEMNPQEINAYYHPVMNEIVFPAGILQAPFFDPQQHTAYNYGAIGAIIGHEMTHGFDDQGRKFDHEGNMVNWWTEQDAVEYSKRTDVIKQQYANYKIEGENVNGELTLGENIADIGGLLIAHHAFVTRQKKNGCYKAEDEEKVFLAWARAWRTHMRKEAQLQRILTDPHSPAICRVNGVVKNIPAYYSVFNIKEGDEMFLEEKDRAAVW